MILNLSTEKHFELYVLAAIAAPGPTTEQITTAQRMDKNLNPYNDYNKPKLRDTVEIIADYKLGCADILLARAVKQFEKA